MAAGEPAEDEAGTAPEPSAILAGLSRGTRRVAVLALHGLNPDEICYVLNLKPAAFRQRLTALRRMLGQLPAPLRREAMALAYARPRREGAHRLDFGLIRRALAHHVGMGSEIGTHDPDGHLLGLRTKELTNPGVAATMGYKAKKES